MKHLGTQKMETQRLILRPFTPEDGEAMFRNWASDPEVTKYLTWPTHADPGVSRWVTEDWVSHYDEVKFYQWAIVLKDLGEPIGSISVVKMNEEAQWVEIGYCIGKNWWHRGIVSEAMNGVMEFLFSQVGVQRIQARHDPRNPNSGAVMRKCGMSYEGTLRRSDRNNQGISDAAVYSILREEYY
ncbi:MAG: GNAT family N-acetyltransferase [Oscillospiraceae bacterium]|nr:GNAT family N-acetyltransferase [Oscillospiraceae bacterium]